MRDGSDIPGRELEVLRALWRIRSGTVRDVLEELTADGRELAYTTVMTLLGRLETRGYVSANRKSAAHVYKPRISRERVASERLHSLVDQLGDGKPVSLILQLFEAGKLSRDDIRTLRGVLDQLESDSSPATTGADAED